MEFYLCQDDASNSHMEEREVVWFLSSLHAGIENNDNKVHSTLYTIYLMVACINHNQLQPSEK